MTAPDEATTDALLSVIRTLDAALNAERETAAKEREAAAKERKVSRREIARLVTMVEGLTQQLDQLLKDRDEERRGELAKVREQARTTPRNVAYVAPVFIFSRLNWRPFTSTTSATGSIAESIMPVAWDSARANSSPNRASPARKSGSPTQSRRRTLRGDR